MIKSKVINLWQHIIKGIKMNEKENNQISTQQKYQKRIQPHTKSELISTTAKSAYSFIHSYQQKYIVLFQ